MKLRNLRNKIIEIKNKFSLKKMTGDKKKRKNRKDNDLLLLISALLIPSFYYFVTIKNSEIINRERYIPLLLCYLWGMFPAVILSLFIYEYLDKTLLDRLLFNLPENKRELINVSIVAPIVEEFSKGIGLFFFLKNIDELEDGLIYGAISGLGFATIENVLYSQLGENSGERLFIVIIRQLTSTILHMLASSKFGKGIKNNNISNPPSFQLRYYLESILYHAVHNFSVSIFPNPLIIISVLITIIILYNILFGRLKKEIRREDIRTENNVKNKLEVSDTLL
jgi:protease PrsW